MPLSPSPVRSKRLALDEPERPLAAMPFGSLCQPQGVALTWTSTRSERGAASTSTNRACEFRSPPAALTSSSSGFVRRYTTFGSPEPPAPQSAQSVMASSNCRPMPEGQLRRWRRKVALGYSESGDRPCVSGCDPYSACTIADAPPRSHRRRCSGGAGVTRAGVGSAPKPGGVAVSRSTRFDGKAHPRVRRHRSSAPGGRNGVSHEPNLQVLGGVNGS